MVIVVLQKLTTVVPATFGLLTFSICVFPGQDFPLTVVDTDTSKKCGLKSDEKYTLRVFSKYIALYDNQKATDRYMWPIK